MKTLDCLGDMCPVPIIKISEELKSMNSNESIKLVTDHSCVVSSLIEKFKNTNVSLQIEEVINGVWEIILTKK